MTVRLGCGLTLEWVALSRRADKNLPAVTSQAFSRRLLLLPWKLAVTVSRLFGKGSNFRGSSKDARREGEGGNRRLR